MATFLIVATMGGAPVEAEPIEGRWYCGFEIDLEDDSIHRDGEISQYVGGEFLDEDGESVDMNGYDYLAEQF